MFYGASLVLHDDSVGGVADVPVCFLVYAHMCWLAQWLLLGRFITETLVISTLESEIVRTEVLIHSQLCLVDSVTPRSRRKA